MGNKIKTDLEETIFMSEEKFLDRRDRAWCEKIAE